MGGNGTNTGWLATGALLLAALLLTGCTRPGQPAERAGLPAETASPTSAPATPTPTPTPRPPAAIRFPAEGDYLAFQSFRDGEEAIYVMKADGSNQRRLLPGVEPAWAPDVRSLAFSQVTGNADTLYLALAGGTTPRRVTTGFTPAWSLDGRMLAFCDTRAGNSDVFIIGADGAGERQLTRQPVAELDPAWSPDGATLAFERDGRIVLIGLDGVEKRTLGDGRWLDGTPAWSPDGRQLAVAARVQDTDGSGSIDRNDDSQIVVMNADGSGRKALTAFRRSAGKPVWAQNPAWSPDGARLSFESNRDGQWDIYVVNLDGTGLKNLTAGVKDSVNLSPSRP